MKIKGHAAEVKQCITPGRDKHPREGEWYIVQATNGSYYLRHDGNWQDGVNCETGDGWWPTREAAEAFAAKHADAESGEARELPTTIAEVAIEESRQQGENEGWQLFEAFLDRCEGFLNVEGMASTDGEIGEVFERFIDEAREDLRQRRGEHLPTAEQLLGLMKERSAMTHGCKNCGEERPPKIHDGRLCCPECMSCNIVCLDDPG